MQKAFFLQFRMPFTGAKYKIRLYRARYNFTEIQTGSNRGLSKMYFNRSIQLSLVHDTHLISTLAPSNRLRQCIDNFLRIILYRPKLYHFCLLTFVQKKHAEIFYCFFLFLKKIVAISQLVIKYLNYLRMCQ